MKKSQSYPQLVESLAELRRHWRTRRLLTGALLAFAGTAAVLLFAVALDNLVRPEDKVWRFGLSLLLWGTLVGTLLTLVVRRWLDDHREDYFAALVEEKHPELHNRLINALQLGRGNHQGFSPRLIEAIVNDAAEATADLDMTRSLDPRPVRRAGLCALAAAVVIGLYAGLLTPLFANGLSRVLLPGADVPPYSATRVVEVRPGATRVPEGNSFTIRARVEGVIPPLARLHRSDVDRPLDMEAEGGTFRSPVKQAARSFTYYVEAGDGRSPTYRVEVVRRPQVEKLTLVYAQPAYTGRPPRTVDRADGDVSDLPGTTVTVRVTASTPLREATLHTWKKTGKKGEEKLIPLKRAGSNRVWEASFLLVTPEVKNVPEEIESIEAPNRYSITLKSTDGGDSLHPLEHTITAARDYPPAVKLVAPEPSSSVSVSRDKPLGKVEVVAEAEDDFGVGRVGLEYRVQRRTQKYNPDLPFTPLAQPGPVAHAGPPERPAVLKTKDVFSWDLAPLDLKPGDRLEYRARASDRNNVTGPGQAASGVSVIEVVLTAEQYQKQSEELIPSFTEALQELIDLQMKNQDRTRAARAGADYAPLVDAEVVVRKKTLRLARAMEDSALPLGSMVAALDNLYSGLMARAVGTLEQGRDAPDQERRDRARADSVNVQEQIVRQLKALLLRMQTNERARKALRKLKKEDPAGHKKITDQLNKMIKGLDELLKDETKLVEKFQRMPKKSEDAVKEDKMRLAKEMEDLQKKWDKWARGTIEELAKLPKGFVDDFNLRKDVNSVYEEIEKAAERAKAQKLEVSLEDLGAGLGTKMKEDLETWMPDSPDNTKWVLEEPLNKKTPKVPEMPLPNKLEDLIGDLLQKAEEFDEEADDVTSSWGDNLDQAGWGVSDGPISTFSAKGKTGNDLPNSNELNGHSGDGRRGKSKGQMVGDTARNLQGRNTPARVNNERYEPGQLKQESNADPKGATGGGKKAGAGRKGLQGGTPPDVVKNIGRLSAKQAGLREKAEQVAKRLSTAGIRSDRLQRGIALWKESEKALRTFRYQDAARKRKEALRNLKAAALEVDRGVGLQMSRARELPPEMRKELLQGADDGYPPGYEALLKNYYKELSKAEK